MRRQITGFIWREWVVDKLIVKHGVDPEEVEEAFFNPPHRVRRAESGKYLLYGRSLDGRYLFIVFAWKGDAVRIISARDMTASERRYFGKK